MSLLQEFYDKQKLKKAVSKIKDTSNSNELMSSFQEAINLVLEPHTQEVNNQFIEIDKNIKEVVTTYSIKELEDRKKRIQFNKAQMDSEFDKEIAEIDKLLIEADKLK